MSTYRAAGPSMLQVVLYLGSLCIAFVVSHAFWVITPLGLAVIAGVIVGPGAIGFMAYGDYPRFVIGAGHILAAILIHPEFTIGEAQHLNPDAQIELLRHLHSGRDTWWVKADLAQTLARSAKEAALTHYRLSSPTWYWIYPPTLALTLWAFVFWFWPRGSLQRSA